MKLFCLSILSLIGTLIPLCAQEITDTLQPIVIEGLNKRIISEYKNIIKHNKKATSYSKFTTFYSIAYDGKGESIASNLEGKTTFVSWNRLPEYFYYSLLPTNDSIATFWSAWNIYLAGWSLEFLYNRNRKIYEQAKFNQKLLIHKETEGQINTYTLYTKDFNYFDELHNSVISVKYDTLQKKVFEFSRVAENGSFLNMKFEKLKTTIKVKYSKKEFIPSEITTMIKMTDQPVLYIKNYNIEYDFVNREEYKYLKSINVYK